MEVVGFSDYLIYPDGRVWSKKSNIFLKEYERKNHYNHIRIYNGKQKTFMIHRLVAIHYIPNPENKPQVDHINRNKHDNRVENLRWVSQSRSHFPITPHFIFFRIRYTFMPCYISFRYSFILTIL